MSFFIAVPTPTILFLALFSGGFYCLVFLFLKNFRFLLNGGACDHLHGFAFFFSFLPLNFFALKFFLWFG